jgi:hypothetical protein
MMLFSAITYVWLFSYHCHRYAVKMVKWSGSMVCLFLGIRASIRATTMYTNAILCSQTKEIEIMYLFAKSYSNEVK